MPRRAGRPSKRTPLARARIIEAVEMGATHDLASRYAGIAHDTLRRWKLADPAFDIEVREAEGRAGMRWLTTIEDAAKQGAWQAAAWKLERRYPEGYGRAVHEITGPDGGPVKTSLQIVYEPILREIPTVTVKVLPSGDEA